MMNYGVYGLCQLLNQLAEIERDLSQRIQLLDASNDSYARELMKFTDPSAPSWLELNKVDVARAMGWIQYAEQQADTLELQSVHDRIEIFNRKLKSQLSLHDFLSEVRTLREAFESGVRFKRFYLYPQAKGQLCIKFENDWVMANRAFPQAKDDARAAVDCYGLGHNTASVFHSMRVVEHGLRELAAAVNVTFDMQMWHSVIEQIECEIREIDKHWSKRTSKSDWMSFYSGAAKEFFYFKAGWRNYVSHGGDPYDEHQAFGVLEHVRAFMTHLATRFGASP